MWRGVGRGPFRHREATKAQQNGPFEVAPSRRPRRERSPKVLPSALHSPRRPPFLSPGPQGPTAEWEDVERTVFFPGKKLKLGGQRDSTVGRSLALHEFDLGSIPAFYMVPELTRSDS